MMNRRGFTLVEMLITVLLMMILLSTIAMIFTRTQETVATAGAQQTVYSNARYALDLMENDLMGCLPFSKGQNRFILRNMRVGTPGQDPQDDPSSNVAGKTADEINFRTTTTVGDVQQTCEVTYKLIPGSKAIGDDGMQIISGNPEHASTKSPPLGTGRALYTLIRQVRVADPAKTYGPMDAWDKQPERTRPDGTIEKIFDMELCQFIIGMNVEYFASNRLYSQLDGSNNPCPPTDPLGNADGVNDDPAGTPIRIPAIRITLVIVEGVGERQERLVPKVIWIPMG